MARTIQSLRNERVLFDLVINLFGDISVTQGSDPFDTASEVFVLKTQGQEKYRLALYNTRWVAEKWTTVPPPQLDDLQEIGHDIDFKAAAVILATGITTDRATDFLIARKARPQISDRLYEYLHSLDGYTARVSEVASILNSMMKSAPPQVRSEAAEFVSELTAIAAKYPFITVYDIL